MEEMAGSRPKGYMKKQREVIFKRRSKSFKKMFPGVKITKGVKKALSSIRGTEYKKLKEKYKSKRVGKRASKRGSKRVGKRASKRGSKRK